MNNKVVVSKDKLTDISNKIRKYSYTNELSGLDQSIELLNNIEPLNLTINGELINLESFNNSDLKKGDSICLNIRELSIENNSVYTKTDFMINSNNYLMRVYYNSNYSSYYLELYKKNTDLNITYINEYSLSSQPIFILKIKENEYLLLGSYNYTHISIINDSVQFSSTYSYGIENSIQISNAILIEENKILVLAANSYLYGLIIDLSDLENPSCIVTQLANSANNGYASIEKLDNNKFVFLHHMNNYATVSVLNLDEEYNLNITSNQISNNRFGNSKYSYIKKRSDGNFVCIYTDSIDGQAFLFQSIIEINDDTSTNIIETEKILDLKIYNNPNLKEFNINHYNDLAYFVVQDEFMNQYVVCFKYENFKLTKLVYAMNMKLTSSSVFSNQLNDSLYIFDNKTKSYPSTIYFKRISVTDFINRKKLQEQYNTSTSFQVIGIVDSVDENSLKIII